MKKERDLNWCRCRINDVDRQIIRLVAKRRLIALRVAKVKMKTDREVFDGTREQAVISSRKRLGEHLHLEGRFVKDLMRLLMDYSKAVQQDFMFREQIGV